MFELRLREFSNPSARDMDGNCCVHDTNQKSVSASGSASTHANVIMPVNSDRNNQCRGLCTTKFRVCVKHYQVTIDHNPPCTFGEASTSELFGDSVINQEFKFPFNFRWPVSNNFFLLVLHFGLDELSCIPINWDELDPPSY